MPRNILIGWLLAILTTLVLVALLFLLHKIYRRVEAALAVLIEAKIGPSANKYKLIQTEQVKTAAIEMVRLFRLMLVLALFYFYLQLTLSYFAATRGIGSRLFDAVNEPLRRIGSAIWMHIPGIFFIAIIVLITRYVLKLMRVFFVGVNSGAITLSGFYPDWAMPTYKIMRIVVIAFAAVLAYPYIPGSDSEAFKGISIFLGVLVSLGSTSLVSNIVAGLTMTYMRAFKVGDRVKISDFTGDVTQTRLQVTHLVTSKNEEIIVPNSMIISNEVINYSSLAKVKGLILHTTVAVGYDVPWRQVRALLLMAAERTDGVLKEPSPFVHKHSLDECHVTYELNAYTDNAQAMSRTYSEMHKNILDLFNEYEVQIMTPSYEGDREAPAIVPKARWYASPADRFDDSGRPVTGSSSSAGGGGL